MARLAAAALALIWVALAPAQAAGDPGGKPAIPVWKPVGSWIVLLLPLARGGMSCTALTRMIPTAGGLYSVGFALSPTSTHFYLNGSAMPKPAPRMVRLAVDGRDVAELKVLLHERFANGEQLLMADLPGAMLARDILPAMVRGRALQVTAGGQHYTISIAEFGTVVSDLQQCAMVALGSLPRLSER